MVAVASVRFIRVGRAIDSPEQRVDDARMDLALAGLMVVLGIALVLYVFHAMLTGL